MAAIKAEYPGKLRTKSRHIKPGEEIITDAPTDNHGRGEFFSPTDLVSAAPGDCMLTITGIAAQRNYFNIGGTTFEITKIITDNQGRISEVILDFHFPARTYSDKEKK